MYQFVSVLKIVVFWAIAVASASDSSNNDINFPPQLDADDIRYYSENHDIDGLHWALTNVFRRSSRNPNAREIVYELPASIVSKGGGSTYTTKYKLAMDLEQAEYLAENLEDTEKAEYFRTKVIPVYKQVLNNIPPLDKLERTGGLYPFKQADIEAGIMQVYNKAIHVTDFEELKDEDGKPQSLLSDTFDA